MPPIEPFDQLGRRQADLPFAEFEAAKRKTQKYKNSSEKTLRGLYERQKAGPRPPAPDRVRDRDPTFDEFLAAKRKTQKYKNSAEETIRRQFDKKKKGAPRPVRSVDLAEVSDFAQAVSEFIGPQGEEPVPPEWLPPHVPADQKTLDHVFEKVIGEDSGAVERRWELMRPFHRALLVNMKRAAAAEEHQGLKIAQGELESVHLMAWNILLSLGGGGADEKRLEEASRQFANPPGNRRAPGVVTLLTRFFNQWMPKNDASLQKYNSLHQYFVEEDQASAMYHLEQKRRSLKSLWRNFQIFFPTALTPSAFDLDARGRAAETRRFAGIKREPPAKKVGDNFGVESFFRDLDALVQKVPKKLQVKFWDSALGEDSRLPSTLKTQRAAVPDGLGSLGALVRALALAAGPDPAGDRVLAKWRATSTFRTSLLELVRRKKTIADPARWRAVRDMLWYVLAAALTGPSGKPSEDSLLRAARNMAEDGMGIVAGDESGPLDRFSLHQYQGSFYEHFPCRRVLV